MEDKLKKSDQIALLENISSPNSKGIFTYSNCPYDLVKQGLATTEGKITIAGRAVLWFLGKGEDQTDSKSSITFDIGKKTLEED